MKILGLLVLLFYMVPCQTQDPWPRNDMSLTANWGRWDPWWPRTSTWVPRNNEFRRSKPREWREPSHTRNSSSNSSHHHHDYHHHESWPRFIAFPVPYPVPQFSLPSVATSPPPVIPTPRPVFPANLGSFGLGAGSATSTSSLLPPTGPISATVTLTGPGGVPLRSTTTSSNGVFTIPSLAGGSPAAQAAAQVVAAAQAAYNAQAAYQAQAAEAARAATQAAYAQQAAAVARNAANTVSSSLGALDQPLPPF